MSFIKKTSMIVIVVAGLSGCASDRHLAEHWQTQSGDKPDLERLRQALKACEYQHEYRRFVADINAEHFREWVEARHCMEGKGFWLSGH